MADDTLYEGREQTLVKHFIFGRYLERFAYKVGSSWKCITYVDCFAGPWNVKSKELRDSSFAIAIEELRKVRDTFSQRGRTLRLRCLFLEHNAEAYKQLDEYSRLATDVEIKTLNLEFESSVLKIVKFAKDGGPGSFPFIFIDPTGWKGIAMTTISPLLQLQPVEILINFMTGHIVRFLRSPQSQIRASFEALFGSTEFRSELDGLSSIDLEDRAVELYSANLKRTGKFAFVSKAVVLNPKKDRSHFHLVYATRHPEGVAVFKEAEKRAMPIMESARAGAQRRGREERTGQWEMDLADSQPGRQSAYFEFLRKRYVERAKSAVKNRLQEKSRVQYDEAWALALSFQLVWESDLNEWIRGWQKPSSLADQSYLTIEGLEARERTPKRQRNHILSWHRHSR